MILKCSVLQSFVVGKDLRLTVVVNCRLCTVDIGRKIPAKDLYEYVKREDPTINEYLGDTPWNQLRLSRFDPPLAVADLEISKEDKSTVMNLEDVLRGRKKIRVFKTKSMGLALAGGETDANFVSVYMEKLPGM